MKKGLFAVFGAVATTAIVVLANSAIATTPAALPTPHASSAAPESAMVAAPSPSSETISPSTTANAGSAGSEDCTFTGTCPSNSPGSTSTSTQTSNVEAGKMPDHSRTITPVSGKPLSTAAPTNKSEANN